MQNIFQNLKLRKPEISDAHAIWKLIKTSPPLDLNSPYCYLIICAHFADTSIVAEDQFGICGFISAYILPNSSNTLFVWQVAVNNDYKRKGIARAMIDSLLHRNFKFPINYLETTVNPSNKASGNFFRSTAKSLNTQCQESVFFSENNFGGQDHEAEILYRIGPFTIS
ncbi:MAG: diaminobutyrate acetyltransferase [Syntrophaceae bacterium]|nr:diaminobutyrate acetyltransferase [Syntrophaceae bacterium]